MKYTIALLLLLLTSCSGSDTEKQKTETPTEELEIISDEYWETLNTSQKGLQITKHTMFLYSKKQDWLELRRQINNTYNMDVYIQVDSYQGFTKGRLSIVNGAFDNYNIVHEEFVRSSEGSNLMNIDDIYEKLFSYYEILRRPEYINNCTVSYEFVEKWSFPINVHFGCDDSVPELDEHHISVKKFWY